MNRRRLLAAIPAVAVLPAVAAVPALADTESPIMVLFRQWVTLRAEENAIYDANPDEWDSTATKAASARTVAVEDRILAEPVTGMADVAVKLCVSTNFGDYEHLDQQVFWTEARALIGGVA